MICPLSKKPILVIQEPINGLSPSLFKNTYWEEEYQYWYCRVQSIKDEIDFKIIDLTKVTKNKTGTEVLIKFKKN